MTERAMGTGCASLFTLRRLKAAGTRSADIAPRFGITPLYVNDIVARRTWKVDPK